MAVNLYEEAIKSTSNIEDDVYVYVPGYANIGPEEPTVCSSVSEFESLYGSTPYYFEKDQEDSGINEGSPEKGYLYAKSLLESGLKVIFHRYKMNGVQTAQATFTINYDYDESLNDGEGGYGKQYDMAVVATSFGRSYIGTTVSLTKEDTNLYTLLVTNSSGETAYSGTISFDPSSSIYFRVLDLGLIEFKAVNSSGELEDVEDALLEVIADSGDYTFSVDGESNGSEYITGLTLDYEDGDKGDPEFSLDGNDGLLKAMATSGTDGLFYPLTDYEVYPSVAYITDGGYYIGYDVALNMLSIADEIKAVALIDYDFDKYDLDLTTEDGWKVAKASLTNSLTGSSAEEKGKGAIFVGCDSHEISPYRIRLGDSFNYLKCLGENIENGIANWIPVANDPNGVSSTGYATTKKINSILAETMAEGKIGISINPIIYSTSAGGYKIMGNRTLLSNDGTLAPNSFLNVTVVVNRVLRASRQAANKLKIVSTNANDTFQKFKQLVAATLDPMVTSGDGLSAYKIQHLAKTEAATINIRITLTVVEGIETFNIYVPYSISLD